MTLLAMDTLHTLFGTLYHFNELIRWGGYTVLVVIVFAETGLLAGFFLPGDSLLVTAGLLAAGDGSLKIWWLLVLLSVAAIAGDSTGYAIGYHLGPRVFNREGSRFFHKDHLTRTQRFYETYGAKTILLARFMPIIRTFAPTVAGVGKMRYRTFLLFNVAGGVGWVASMILAGYCLGRSIPDIERYLHWVVGTVILLSVIPIAREWSLSRRHAVTTNPRVPPAETAQGKEAA